MLQDVMARIGQRTILAGVAGLVLGCLIGWILLGWIIFPVTWTNADPYDLRPEQKAAYISLVADSYSINSDGQLARDRLAGFGREEISDILAKLVEDAEKAGDPEGKRRLQYLGVALDVSPAATTPGAEPTPQSAAARATASVRSLIPICGLALVLLVMVALIAVIVFRLLQGRAASAPDEAVGEVSDAAAMPQEAPLGRFVTKYNFGDDGYDTSFNIETHGPESEFYGACGVGFSEVLGEGSPDKVAAFEVWIFDKTDMDNVQTVTKVLMSEFAYNSQMLRDKMKDRGEAVLAEKGKPIVIGGVGLELRAEVVDFQYGAESSLPPKSYFEKLTIQLVPVFKG
jgi:hypothetical protein